MSKISFDKLYNLLVDKGFTLVNVYCIETNKVVFVECSTSLYQQKFFIHIPEKYIMTLDNKAVKNIHIKDSPPKLELFDTMKHLRDIFDVDIKLILLSCYSLTMYDPISNSIKSFSFKLGSNKIETVQEESNSSTKIQLLEKEIDSLNDDNEDNESDTEEEDDMIFEQPEERTQNILVPKTQSVKLSNIVFGVVFISFTIIDFLQSKSIDEKYIVDCQKLLTDNLKEIVLTRAKAVEQRILQIGSSIQSKTDKNCERVKTLNANLIGLGELLTKSVIMKNNTQKESLQSKLDVIIEQLKKEIKYTSDEIYKIQDVQDELLSNSEYLIQEFNRH
jgi:hypothetical protein